MIPHVPVLPESAPFTPEQRAYLNGFFAGLFSRGAAPASGAGPAEQLAPLTILFGSQTGTAESLAKRAAKEAAKRKFAATVHDLGRYPIAQLASEKRVLVITSTYGDGEPPDNAREFWEKLSQPAAPRAPDLEFSVCALGDTNYPKFCAFGKSVDARLQELGGKRIHERTDCDLDLEEPFQKWLALALSGFGGAQKASAVLPTAAPEPQSRNKPCPAPLLVNQPLNQPGSAKETRHFEFSLELPYEAGDALGVAPSNCPTLVREVIAALRCSESEPVPLPGGAGSAPLFEALLHHYEITKIPPALLKAFAERTSEPLLKTLTAPNVNGELSKFLWGREIIDLLLAYPQARFSPEEFTGFLRKLQPRLYSISSSPKAHQGRVHLTTAIVRYESLGRKRHGVCSTFLADRAECGKPVPVFVHHNKNFRLPEDGGRPIILVGPGTGIAPFRGFLHERQAASARGKNWLFFGDQHEATDFLYRNELERFQAAGVLTKLSTAFSRDQEAKIYVQDRMLENAAELFRWLEEGASFFVCGDAKRMAKDVDAALHRVVESAAGKTKEQAEAYVAGLKSEGRYKRDVY